MERQNRNQRQPQQNQQRFPLGTKISKVFFDEERGVERPFGGVVERYGPVSAATPAAAATTTSDSSSDADDGDDGGDGGGYQYRVVYEDGDEEDLTEEEVAQHLPSAEAEDGAEEAAAAAAAATTNSRKRKAKGAAPKRGTKASKNNSSTPTGTGRGGGRLKPAPVAAAAERSGDDTSPTAATSASATASGSSSADDGGGGNGNKRPSRGASRVNYNYNYDDDDEFDDTSVDDEDGGGKRPPKKKAAKKKQRQAAASSARLKKADDDEDASVSSSEDDDDILSADEEESESDDGDYGGDDDDDDDEGVKPKKRAPAAKKKAAAKGGKAAGATAAASSANSKTGKKKMYESFQPMNAPSFPKLSLEQIEEEKEYLDPCGQEGSDDIIGRLVGDQVDKLGPLLKRALEKDESLGSLANQLKLGTACSGTDAPALALTLVQEQLELRGESYFSHSHEFSCENDPFKQAYLARNFDSKLFPDIAKLVDNDDPEYKPRDVYGQETDLPPCNMFVAGTSCKNFSMLRAKYRIDVEDKGCSGETFFGAVDVIHVEQPAMALFENVIGAPWGKMSEYITGRVRLSDCATSKAIQGLKTSDKSKELTFVLEGNDNEIVVDSVPPVYGVKCGAVVRGFLKKDSTEVCPIKWPSGVKKSKSCSLSDLINANAISKADDTLVFKTDSTYCTQTAKVDTKDFGLPQTRNRTYMFVWKVEGDDDIYDDLGDYWDAVVNHLKSPVRHALDAFILDVDHEVIRVFREALNGPPGRISKRGCFLEPDFWTSSSANLPHNTYTRAALGVEDRARWLTEWSAYGGKQVPPTFWLEYLNCMEQRRVDFLCILYASGLRDAELHDALYSNFNWNLTQNASREKHRTACPGISGCITPGGDIFLPHKGRPLLGCEKLLLQGIPYFRLILGNESEVQLGDLAGNAMSLTVVGATMLAALTCKQLREETEARAGKSKDLEMVRNAILNENNALGSGVKPISSVKVGTESASASCEALPLFRKLAALADAAIQASIGCTCETSGCNSRTTQFLQCRVCRISCCRNCVGQVAGYNMACHDTQEVTISEAEHSDGTFRAKLRNLLPPMLEVSEGGWQDVEGLDNDRHRVQSLRNCTFLLHRIKRERRKWLVTYYAKDNHGIGEAVAELRLVIGELKTEEISSSDPSSASSVAKGLMVEIKSFIPARIPPFVSGSLEPCARLVIPKDTEGLEEWSGNDIEQEVSVDVSSSGSTASLRKEVGLISSVADDIKAAVKGKKEFQEAKKCGEERRWLYPSGWQSWPETISIKLQQDAPHLEHDINGEYKRADCRQTTNQSALWVKPGSSNNPSLYIIIRPNVNRTGPDCGIIASSLDHSDESSVLAIFPRDWQPGDAFQSKTETLKLKKWCCLPSMKCLVPHSDLAAVTGDASSNTLVSVTGLSTTQVKLFCRDGANSDNLVKLNVTGGQLSQQIVRVFNSLCVAPILQVAARSGLAFDLSPNAAWIEVPSSSNGVAFGRCTKTVPTRPSEIWVLNAERSENGKKKVWERSTDPGASRKYYLALQEARQPFELWLDRSSRSLTVKCYPDVVAHHAAGHLVRGRGSEDDIDKGVKVAFKLSDIAQQPDPEISPYTVGNCNREPATEVALTKPFHLYERQQKVVTKMLAIDEGKERPFTEVEMSEFELPGSAGLSLIAKASRETSLRGGVIADAIGAGKTVISIAIILERLEQARASRQVPRKSGATLVVVPPALIDQWESEIKKFSSNLVVVKIYDYDTLARVSVRDIINSDVIICPIDILEADGYLPNLFKSSGLKEYCDDPPKLPQYSGQAEQNAARGVWFPASSADPYGGGNNPLSQKRRDQSAYYTVAYQEAISELRKKKFDSSEKGVPLEYYEFERMFVDEIHESLCTTKSEMDEAKESASETGSGFFKEKNRRAGRELLGITQRDTSLRPIVVRRGDFGLTGTPLLDSSSRVIELANLMGGVYVIGLSSHWRKLERESSRDIFLHNYLEPKSSREIRKTVHSTCQQYLTTACCRNKAEKEMEGIKLQETTRRVNMPDAEKVLYLKSQSGITSDKQSLSIKPEDFDVSAGHDISRFLRQNAKLDCRGKELVSICRDILSDDSNTKIIVFTDGKIGAGNAARDFLIESGIGCTWLDQNDSVQVKNQKISRYQTGDATDEDRKRPRVLVLHFEHAAGLNLQSECYNLILFTPLYIGVGGSSSDAVADTSTELQAIGRVFRPGQPRPQVHVFRIDVRGPKGEECLDGQIIRRNTDQETIDQAVNAGDDDSEAVSK